MYRPAGSPVEFRIRMFPESEWVFGRGGQHDWSPHIKSKESMLLYLTENYKFSFYIWPFHKECLSLKVILLKKLCPFIGTLLSFFEG